MRRTILAGVISLAQWLTPPPDEWLGGIFEMIGAGKEDFAGVDADDYVRQLRKGWE